MSDDRADTDSQGEAAAHHPSVMRALRKSIADAWLYLGLFVAVNVIWVILLGLPLGLLGRLALNPAVAVGGLLTTVLTLAAGNAMLFRLANRMAHGDVSLRDFRDALARYSAGSLALVLVLLAILALGAFNVYFYLQVVSGPWWRVIGVVWGYVVVMFALAMLYCYPLLVEQGCGPLTAMKRSVLLTLDNPGYTLGVAGALVLWTFVAVLPALLAIPVLVGLSALVLCFVEAGFVALVANNALLELLRKYQRSERQDDVGGSLPGDPGS